MSPPTNNWRYIRINICGWFSNKTKIYFTSR